MASINQDQQDFWTHDAGPTWVTYEAALDRFLAPVLARVIDHAGLGVGHHALDVGCGTGQSTLEAGHVVGPSGQALGVDISATMIERAKARASGIAQVAFALADAADHPFQEAYFDRVISRFGVMFFADPVAAFRNIARAIRPGGKIAFATWGQIPCNPWFTLPAQIAKAELGAPPKSDPDAPGPFAFRDIAKVCGILEQAGFDDVSGVAEDMSLALPGGAAEIAALSVHVGPAAGTVKHFQADQAAQDRIRSAMTDTFSQFDPDGIPAEINFFTAAKS